MIILTMNEKEEIIKKTYGTNSGTAYETYRQIVEEHPSIRLQDVKDYLNSHQDIQVKAENKEQNSCVYSGVKFEFETDIMGVLARDGGDGIRYGLCAIDNFTKMVSVIPINNRKPSEIIRGLKLIFEQLGKPKQLYSDEESRLRSNELFRLVNENNINTIQTLTHAHTIERFICTFRMNLQR